VVDAAANAQVLECGAFSAAGTAFGGVAEVAESVDRSRRLAGRMRGGSISSAKLKAIVKLLSERLALEGVLHGLRPGLARQLDFVFLQDRLQERAELLRVPLGFPHLEHLEVGIRARGHVIRHALGRPDPLILHILHDAVVL
jgi:hypothetical protein